MPAPMPLPDPAAIRHTWLDDAQGYATGITLCSLGLVILSHLGLMTGQTAGAALILSYITDYSFGLCFFVVNLPFYWLAYKRMGVEFTLRTLGVVTVLSVVSDLLPLGLRFDTLNPATGAVIFGVVTAAGLLAIFRHNASLGGIGIVGLYIQDKTGFRAGWVQLMFDACLFALAAVLFPLSSVAYSLLGAVVVNVLIGINHRRDRYIAR